MQSLIDRIYQWINPEYVVALLRKEAEEEEDRERENETKEKTNSKNS